MAEYFWMNFLVETFWEDFWEDFLGGFFMKDFFLGGILWEEINIEGIDCLSRFWFLSRFCLKAEEGKFRSLEVRVQAYCS